MANASQSSRILPLLEKASRALPDSPWAVSVIHPCQLVLIYDSRPEADVGVIIVVAGLAGQVVETAAIQSDGVIIAGALVSRTPEAGDLEELAAKLRRLYAIATMPSPDMTEEP